LLPDVAWLLFYGGLAVLVKRAFSVAVWNSANGGLEPESPILTRLSITLLRVLIYIYIGLLVKKG